MGTFFRGGTIWCGLGRLVQTLRVDDGKIVEINGLPGHNDEVVDLGTNFLAPSFMDGHAHPLFAGREAQGPLVNGLQTITQILAEVERFAAAHPESSWIIGGAYEASVIERGDFLATWLDEVVSDRPVVLHAVDHHTIWVNSKALEISNITKTTADPAGGTIARNQDGGPRGTLREPAAMDLVMRHAPVRTLDSDIAAIAWASERYLENGVTAATDAWVEPGMAEAYLAADINGVLKIDMNLFFLVQPDSWQDRLAYFASIRQQVESLGSNSRLVARTIKIIADGALSSGTAALLQPYLDDPTSSGLLIWKENELLDAALHFDLNKYQLHIHAIGDAAIRQALDVIEKVIDTNPSWDRRPVIAHAQLISEQDLGRFAALDVIANYQPLWVFLDSMNSKLIAPRIGDTRNNQQYQLASMVNAGARISYGSDWPITSNIPLEALAIPTHRQSPEGLPKEGWSPEESISIEESLSFYTAGVAYQTFNENRFGRLEVGMTADLMILSENPLAAEPHRVAKLKVTRVYKTGRLIFPS